MTTALAERPLTGADVAALPADLPSGSVRYELWEGVLHIMSPTTGAHGSVESNVAALLKAHGEWRGYGRVQAGEVGVYLRRSPDTLVGVDAAFLTPDQLPPRRSPEGYLETVPALIVEVVSRNDRASEVRRKVAAYLRAGARAVWVVDPQRRAIAIHGADRSLQTLRSGDTFAGEFPIPGLVFPVERLFDGLD